MKQLVVVAGWIAVALLIFVGDAQGQPLLDLPRVSPGATHTQTIGLAEIEVSYHRPGVRGRTIWGGLVPFDRVWRAGANENTTISFSHDVMIEGEPLPAGRYGLHVLPQEDGLWQFIFSNQSDAWGSFSYDEAEDALRVELSKEERAYQERMSFSFDDPTENSVELALNWENLRLYVTAEFDMEEIIIDSIQTQLRGLPRFFWQGWSQAATWCLQNDFRLDLATEWIDRSLTINRGFENLNTKAQILEIEGNQEEADQLREEAMAFANEAQLNNYGYQILGRGDVAGAIEIFVKNLEAHPESWNCHDSLAEAYAADENVEKAIEYYRKAHSMVDDDGQKERIATILESLEGS